MAVTISPLPSEKMVEIGAKLRSLRETSGATQAAVAVAMGASSRSTLSNLEVGRFSLTLSTALALADYFSVPLDELLCRKVPLPAKPKPR